MASILDSLRELASSAIVSILTRQTNESEFGISKAFSAAIPAMAATIAKRSDDHGFMKELTDLASLTESDPVPLKTITRLASSGGTAIDTTTPTGGFLSNLFGPNLSGMIDALSNYSGIRGSSAASIVSVTALLVLRYIGRTMRSDNLTTVGLADRLRSQRNQLASAVPLGFEMPEFSHSPFRAGWTAVDESARRVQAREAENRWTVPVLALLGMLGIGSLIWWAGQKPVVQVSRVDVTEPTARPMMPPVGPIRPADRRALESTEKPVGTTGVAPAIGTTGMILGRATKTLPGNVTISIPSGGAEDRLYGYLSSAGTGGTTIMFDRITFGSGSAVLASEARDQVDNVATILRAYPNVSVIVSGFTDNEGREHANMALSKARAEAVAGRLVAKGVSSKRVHSEGFGSQKPMADNSTEAGRSENRRVALDVK